MRHVCVPEGSAHLSPPTVTLCCNAWCSWVVCSLTFLGNFSLFWLLIDDLVFQVMRYSLWLYRCNTSQKAKSWKRVPLYTVAWTRKSWCNFMKADIYFSHGLLRHFSVEQNVPLIAKYRVAISLGVTASTDVTRALQIFNHSTAIPFWCTLLLQAFCALRRPTRATKPALMGATERWDPHCEEKRQKTMEGYGKQGKIGGGEG